MGLLGWQGWLRWLGWPEWLVWIGWLGWLGWLWWKGLLCDKDDWDAVDEVGHNYANVECFC